MIEVVPEQPGEGWRDRAACKGMPIELFFPDHNEGTGKAVCARCPVQRECLADADAHGEAHGIRGGITMSARRKKVKALRECPQCGTWHSHPRFCSHRCRLEVAALHDLLVRQSRADTSSCRWCGGDLVGGRATLTGFCSWVCESSHRRDKTRRLLA